MVQPLLALLSLVLLPLAAPDAATAPGPFAALRAPSAAAIPAVAEAEAGIALTARAAATSPSAVLDDEAPRDGHGCLLPSAGATAPLVLDLRRPRLLAAAVPETPHPTAVRRRDAEVAHPLPDLHLVRLTKDRGS